MAPEFNTFTVVTTILEELGYNRGNLDPWSGLDYKEYEINKKFVRFRLPYGSEGHKRYGILRVDGQKVHVHGSQVTCAYINLADPGSLNALRSALVSAEEPNGNPGKS